MSDKDKPAPRLLIADDQADVLEALRLLLKGKGFRITACSTPSAILASLGKQDFDAVLMDLNYARDTTSGREGLDLLPRIQSIDATLPVIVMTAWGSVEVAVEAMRRGAKDFIEKPWDNARVLSIIRTQIELRRALRAGERLEAENRLLRGDSREELIASAASMEPVLRLLARVGPSEANVLLTGENGTGKSLVARSLHALSPRTSKPLVTVNAGGLSEGVFESELFGHVKGAYTDAKSDRVGRFELADDGTLFLDEIANIPFSQQAKLLRVLETGDFERVGSSRTRTVNVRVFSATNADLDEEIEAGRFRQDLLFRLNTVEIAIPALRDRGEDIPALADRFLETQLARYRKSLKGFESSAVEAMMRYPWPGNVRELDHAVERGVLMAQGERIAAEDLGLRSGRESVVRFEDMKLEEAEKYLIDRALSRNDGNVSKAARTLGLSRSALYRRLEKFRP